MPIDNDVYNRHGAGWWDEDEPLNMLHGSVTPARFGYFAAVLKRLGRDPSGLRAVDIGCGGGFLAEEFARLGCRVVGVDPTSTIAWARGSTSRSRTESSTSLSAATSSSTSPTWTR